jgi:hypothetical protein
MPKNVSGMGVFGTTKAAKGVDRRPSLPPPLETMKVIPHKAMDAILASSAIQRFQIICIFSA